MATCLKHVFFKQVCLRRLSALQIKTNEKLIRICSTVAVDSQGRNDRNPFDVFIHKNVQELLQKITGFDLDKIFASRKSPMETAQYRLLTDDQLEKEQSSMTSRAVQKLQMPPFLPARKTDNNILSNDSEIDGLHSCNHIFTDISFGVPNWKRLMVVRETNGVLRKAKYEERDRMNQIYFPTAGRMYFVPKMFESEYLEEILDKEKYQYILDRACIQFEPDDPSYIRVTHRTFEHIEARRKHDVLRSTRHFGPMAFYFLWYKKIEGLLQDMIQSDLLCDGADLVRLYSLVHPDRSCSSAIKDLEDDVDIVKAFIDLDARQKGPLELALQSYVDTARLSGNAAT